MLQMPSFELGPYGSVFLVGLVAVTTFLSWRQRGWERAANSADKELDIQRTTVTRLEDENKNLRHDNTTLKIKSDLTPLLECINKLDAGMLAWTVEGRGRFDRSMERLDSIHLEQAAAQKAMLSEMQAQREHSERILTDLMEGFKTHTASVATILKAVEQRLGGNGRE